MLVGRRSFPFGMALFLLGWTVSFREDIMFKRNPYTRRFWDHEHHVGGRANSSLLELSPEMPPCVRKFGCCAEHLDEDWKLQFRARKKVVSYHRGHEIWHQSKKCTVIREIPTKLPQVWICVILHTMLLPEKMASPKPPKPHPPPEAEPGYTKITKAHSSEPANAAKTPRSVKEKPKTP